MPADADQLESRLAAVLQPRGSVLTAYSGGIDSTLVAVAARRVLGKQAAPAAIGDSASLPRRELLEARRIAADLDFQLIEVQPDEQSDPGYQANAGNRCYFCKTHLYQSLHKLAADLSIRYIANGTNADDLGDHRPGLQAADEAQVISPLLEAGFAKSDVRLLAGHWKLPNADKPPAACLASRIPYGTAVTPDRLTRIEQAEEALYDLGFRGFRVRHHETIARLELPLDQLPRLQDDALRTRIVQRLTSLGYTFVTLDLAGFRSGSGNLALPIAENR